MCALTCHIAVVLNPSLYLSCVDYSYSKYYFHTFDYGNAWNILRPMGNLIESTIIMNLLGLTLELKVVVVFTVTCKYLYMVELAISSL